MRDSIRVGVDCVDRDVNAPVEYSSVLAEIDVPHIDNCGTWVPLKSASEVSGLDGLKLVVLTHLNFRIVKRRK